MKVKPGVQIKSMHPMLLEAILAAHEVYIDAGQRFTITSLTDGKHSPSSLHYSGKAADFRTRDLLGFSAKEIGDLIRAKLWDFSRSLGYKISAYDVVVEKDHIHVEYDPKESL